MGPASPSGARLALVTRSASLSSSLEPSSLTFPNLATTVEARDFYVFHNVLLQNDSLFYFLPDDKPLPLDMPAALRLSRFEVQIDLPVIVVNSSNRAETPHACSQPNMQQRPALLFAGTPWDSNIFEFFGTTMMPMFQTATMTGLLDPDRIQALDRLPGRERLLAELHHPQRRSPFTLISGRATFYGAPWSYLIDSFTVDQQTLQHMPRTCFSTLVVSEDAVLRFLYERVVEMRDQAYRKNRAEWLQKFRKHLIAAERVHLRAFEKHWPQSVGDADRALKRPRITIASRPYRRRGILNEPDIVHYLTQNYDVNVTEAKFTNGLAASVALMQETDVLIGMHGAGLTNAFWMKDGGVLLQLLPYGWEVYPGQLIRSCISADIPLALHGYYLQWVNPHPHHAWFDRDVFTRSANEWDKHPMWGPKVTKFSEHPDESMPLPKDPDAPDFWMYQNTWVDMDLFSPVLDEAMSLIRAKRI